MKFSWVPIYKEMAHSILDYRDRQKELIDLLLEIKAQGLPVIRLEDKNETSDSFKLQEIDPFTFFASFNRRLTNENRKSIIKFIKKELRLSEEVPSDYDGIPVVDNRRSWFFSWSYIRKSDDINLLWNMANAAITKTINEINPSDFDNCLGIEGVSIRNLTIGCFWLNPNQFLALDARNREFCKDKYGLELDGSDYSSYIRFLDKVHNQMDDEFVQISRDAWLYTQGTESERQCQYWAGGFQWDETSKLEEFVSKNYWQNGYNRNQKGRSAKRS